MIIKILNHFDSKVIFECEADSLKIGVELAVKSRANLSGADLSRANLSGADLSRANLSGADLYGANLSGADLSRANLSRANLSGANLYRANLSRANLSRANLSGANLSRADLSGANLYGEKIVKNPIQILNLKWDILIFKVSIKIGCELHTAIEWFSFSDEQISEMYEGVLDWWNIYKPIIKQLWEEHCRGKNDYSQDRDCVSR